MPLYEFKCNNPESPYYNNPKTVLWSFKKFNEERDNMVCEITGEKLERVISTSFFKLKGEGWTRPGKH